MDQGTESTGGRRHRGVNETSIWKKEIAFAAPVAAPVEEPPVEAPEPVVETRPVEPVAEAPPVEPDASEPVAPEPVAPAPVAPEPLTVEPEPEPVAEAEPEPEPAVEPEPEAEALSTVEALEPAPAPRAAVAAPPPLPQPSGEYGWLTDGLDAPPAPVVAQAPPPPQDDPEPELEFEIDDDAEPYEPDTDERVPFWKKDISLSRRPKPERKPKPPKAKKEKEKKPSRRARKQQAAAEASAVEAERKRKEASTPFWKRDLSLRKKGEKAEKPAKPAKTKAKEPKTTSEPFWKRDFSLKRSPAVAKSAPIERGKKKKGKKDVVVGLKIGASQLAAARVVNNGSPEVVQVAREPLADGIIVGGELRDPETLAAELSAFFSRHKLPKRNVRLGIANNRIGVRTFEISGIDDPRQLANAIRFRAQETLPIPLEEAVLDWQVLSETHDDETGTTRRVLLVVAYRELVDRYIAACKKAGVRLAGIDLEAFAMLRAVIPPPPPDASEPDGASVVVNVGHDRSTLAVSDGRICEFTRVLSWGGQSLSVAIARSLDQTPSEVDPLKHALVFGGTVPAPDGFSQEQADAAAEAVSRELQAFARELVSSLRFYQNQPNSLGIGQIVVTGGTSHMPGLAAELEKLIGVTVRVGDPLGRVKLGKRFKDPEQIGSFAVAVGLGIDD